MSDEGLDPLLKELARRGRWARIDDGPAQQALERLTASDHS